MKAAMTQISDTAKVKNTPPEITLQPTENNYPENPLNTGMAVQRLIRQKPRSLHPAEILQLQHTIGNQAVARLLHKNGRTGAGMPGPSGTAAVARRREPGVAAVSDHAVRSRPLTSRAQADRGQIQRARTPLTSKEVIEALKGMKFMKKQLASKVHAGTKELGANADLDVILKEERVDLQIARVLQNYDAHFGKKQNDSLDLRDAMMLSMALEGVARVIAERLNDASILPELTVKLFEIYQKKISNNLKSKKRSLRRDSAARANVMALTAALVAGNPVSQYMHREISKAKAAGQIIAMANEAAKTDNKIDALKMYSLMEQKFQAQMASISKEQLHIDDKDTKFSTREAHGEYSTYYFKELFGKAALAQPTDRPGFKDDNGKDRLDFTQNSEARLKELKDEVITPTPQAILVPRQGVTDKQEKRLQEMEAAEATADRVGMRQNFVDYFKEHYSMLQAEADKLYDEVETFIYNAPLTLTVKAQSWFDGANPPDSSFKPAGAFQKQTPVNQVFGKTAKKLQDTVTHLPTWDDSKAGSGEERGPRYLRFRAFKDQTMTGLNEFSAAEMPVFAALNVNWETTKGSDTEEQYGTNYYGDLHFMLKKNNFKDRVVYTATDHGAPRRDPMLTLNDFAFGGRGLTRLKKVNRPAVIDAVVNAARTKAPAYGLALVFEIQIFGGLDIKTDVSEITISDDISASLENKIKLYYTSAGLNIPVKRAGQAPPGGVKGLDEAMVKQMLKFEELSQFQKKRLNKMVDTSIAGSTGKQNPLTMGSQGIVLLKSAYSMVWYVEKLLTEMPDTLTDSDLATLTKVLATARGMAGGLNYQVHIDQAYKTRLATLLTTTEELLKTVKAAGKKKKRGSVKLPKATPDLALVGGRRGSF